jgi:hypothetical protein
LFVLCRHSTKSWNSAVHAASLSILAAKSCIHKCWAKLIINLLMTSVSCPFPSICSFLFFQIVFFSWCFCLLLFCISSPFLPVGLMHQHRALISSKAQLRSNHGSWQLMPLEVDTLQTTEILKRSQAHL